MMKTKELIKYYSPAEEKINIISHSIGLALSIIALIFLVIYSALYGNIFHFISFSVFGTSLVLLYSASTLYHSEKTPELRKKLKINDHASIYVLIAGSYTPFALVTLSGTFGWILLSLVWGIALTGIILKLFFTGRYSLVSTIMYILMGWLIIFFIKPLINNLHPKGLFWVFTGGISYTIGAIIYSIKKIKFNHAIFHIFVLIGSICHFISIFFYVLLKD